MKIGTQTKKHALSSKSTKAKVQAIFQDGRCRHFGNSRSCYGMGNYHPILIKVDTQTKTDMLSS
jgi:hypothetical protein